ncbi:Glycosyltransferase Family 4 protein [Tuber magnatum]|uniref:GDP-Man:Man(3)GlcNAc(2)-PP-Dol alpha-1,2-mannosyltransferase n=1 Tax=Tuber magnatum TaxID=42249 RepID=A0A317SIE7_9PEZI|nr:Glycosyltransferase Family 4 protein [Tuber magnatum]
MLSYIVTAGVVLLTSTLLSYFLLLRAIGTNLRRRSAAKKATITRNAFGKKKATVVGFFHPYCNAGGGGERVLWAAIRATQEKWDDVLCAVYTGDQDADKETILSTVKSRFDIDLDHSRIVFLFLSTRRYVSATTYPHFTLLGQSLGSLILAWDAFTLLVPDIFIDTMGYAFTLPMAKLMFGIPTGAYVHYPTISTDMLSGISSSAGARVRVKILYWKFFAMLYGFCGNGIDVIMCNSTWTAGHLRSLWPDRVSAISVVFPPVAVEALTEAIPLSRNGIGIEREKVILCIAQFRPEKKHDLIIDSFAHFLRENPSLKDTKLVLIGSVRHLEDRTRVYDLRLLTHEKGIKDNVVFICDASWGDILQWLGRSWIGVNAMWNEHFGIGVVEYQAAGLISVVHNSGGPKIDIVIPGTGFHATTKEEFADGYRKALELEGREVANVRQAARKSAERFTEKVFAEKWLEAMAKLLQSERTG